LSGSANEVSPYTPIRKDKPEAHTLPKRDENQTAHTPIRKDKPEAHALPKKH